MKSQKRQYNTLNFQQKLKLIDFLRSNTYEDGTYIKQIAKDASPTVGFYVTEHNIRSTAAAAGIKLPSWRVQRAELQQDTQSTRELWVAVEELSRRLNNVENKLYGLSLTEEIE